MKPLRIFGYSSILILLCSSFYFVYKQDERVAHSKSLYRIFEKGKWGYIDKTGKVVISPRFYAALDFSEGLAPVRQGGMYGYIDEKGSYVLNEQYDYAEPFHNGQAKVYIEGKPCLIDRSGKILFEHNLVSFGDFTMCSYSPAETASGRTCLINSKGEMLTDTIFDYMYPFSDGKSVVKAYDANEYGVIDTSGKWIIPFGKYDDIKNFSEGYAIVTNYPKNESLLKYCINDKGEIMYQVPYEKWHPNYLLPEYHDGLLIVDIKKDSRRNNLDNEYPGAVNLKGEIVFSDSNWREISFFSHGRAFVQHKFRDWMLINERGGQVGNTTYEQVWGMNSEREDFFENGKALVLTDTGWIFIDVNGNLLHLVSTERFDRYSIARYGDVVVLEQNNQQMIVQTRRGFYYASDWYEGIAISTLQDDLMEVTFSDYKGKKWGYVNADGKTVWKSVDLSAMNPNELNIDFMNRGYCFAASEGRGDLTGYGGWGGSSNGFRKISGLKTKFTKHQFQIIIDTTVKSQWAKSYPGFAVYVVNDSADTVYFSAQDSRIEMVMQARDRNGMWKNIEYLPSSWCGNSYHTLHLPPQAYWEFATPIYHGAFSTKLRACLLCKRGAHVQEELVYYSNEISGSVNPAQFWRKREYFPQGIMDPYNE